MVIGFTCVKTTGQWSHVLFYIYYDNKTSMGSRGSQFIEKDLSLSHACCKKQLNERLTTSLFVTLMIAAVWMFLFQFL